MSTSTDAAYWESLLPSPRPKATPKDNEGILVWPDGTWCYRYELREYAHMSDDYTMLSFGTPEYEIFQEIS